MGGLLGGVLNRALISDEALGEQLVRASGQGELQSVEQLLEQGAPVNYETVTGLTPLSIAAVFGEVTVMDALIHQGGAALDRDSNGITALCMASRYGMASAMQVLISAGAEIDFETGRGSTALIEAVLYSHLEVIECLVEAQCDLDLETTTGKLQTCIEHPCLFARALRAHRTNQGSSGRPVRSDHHPAGMWG